MTDSIDVAGILASHQQEWGMVQCAECRDIWPCDAIKALRLAKAAIAILVDYGEDAKVLGPDDVAALLSMEAGDDE